MIGQSYSTSQNAGMITFQGGPYDGQSGLFDHNYFDSISFCDSVAKVTLDYKPLSKGRSWIYIFVRSYKWGSR